MNDPKSEKAHAHDCAIAINARHGCTCEGAPEPIEDIKADIVRGSYSTLSKEYEKLEAENASLKRTLSATEADFLDARTENAALRERVDHFENGFHSSECVCKETEALKARADSAEAACVEVIEILGMIDHESCENLPQLCEQIEEIGISEWCLPCRINTWKNRNKHTRPTSPPSLPPELVERMEKALHDCYQENQNLHCMTTISPKIGWEALNRQTASLRSVLAAVEAHRKGQP